MDLALNEWKIKTNLYDIHICIHDIHSQFIVVSFGFFFQYDEDNKKKTDVNCRYVCDIKKKKDIKEENKNQINKTTTADQ